MRTVRVLLVVLLAACIAGCKVERAPEGGEQAAAPKALVADVAAKKLELTGEFCLREGILDYLAVTSGGQEYESVLALGAKGSEIHKWLLAFGAVPGPTREVLEALQKKPPEGVELPRTTGTPLEITVTWQVDGKTVTVPARELLINRKEQKPQAAGGWTFTGSNFSKDPDTGKEFYMADVDRALISVVYNGAAVINFDSDAGNPYAAEDEGYAVHTELVPPFVMPKTFNCPHCGAKTDAPQLSTKCAACGKYFTVRPLGTPVKVIIQVVDKN